MTSNVRISIYGGADATTAASVFQRVQLAADDGFTRIWFSQGNGVDVLTALAVAGLQVPNIQLGTAVVPLQGRHPITLAQHALTVASAVGNNRLLLGLGVTHAAVSEQWYGIPYASVVERCRENLVALDGLLSLTRTSEMSGTYVTARAQVNMDVPAPTLFLAALGPKMLDLAATYAAGTITWMTGARGVREVIRPGLDDAAAARGQPKREVIVGLPVCVTDRPDDVRRDLAPVMARTATLASYRRMVRAEAVDEPVDLAIIGTRDEVLDRVGHLATAGADELLANVVGSADEIRETRELLASLG